ncbi:Endo-beta-N-acetylglucosaminidase D, partial [Granulicatella balaenopterae]
MKNKKSFRKYGVTCLCVFAGVSLSTNAFGNVVFATEFVAPNVVNNTSMQSELKNTIENQPISSYWYPDTLLKWSAEMDEDAVFNKSLITLAKRVDKDKLVTVNDTQNKDVKVVAISIMNANTSGNPSQGSNKFSANTFSYWQYIDTLVYWGGSAGEGLIVPPSPDVTDAAHRNGVPVLGTIFFPQTEHGGKMEWLNTFLQKDNQGNFPMVDKLIEVLEAYHFDGWFINQETQGTEKDPLTVEHAQLMQEFIKQFKTKVGDKYQMMWYDSMTKEGKMHWQNALTDKNDYFLIDDAKNPVADSMFLNFGWIYNAYKDLDLLNASNQKAKELGINPYDLYAGIDVQANGYNTGVRWTHFQRDDQVPFTSLGLYCPSWTYFNASTPTEFQDNEARLWVNEFADPTKKTQAQGYEWRGISTYAVEKSAVTTLPFVTNFSLGNGYDFYRYGQKVSTQDWNNRSLNDIMPTYRWMIKQQEGTELLAAIDYTTAYYAGNSIKLSGVLAKDAPATIKLYQADVTIPVGAVYKTTAKATSQVQLDLVLTFDDGEEAIISGNQVLGNDWTTVNYDISAYVGKAIQTIAYQITGSQDVDDFTANMGNITLEVPGSSSLVNTENLKVADVDFKDGIYAGVRLAWNSADSDVQHFEIYRVMADGSKVLLGATPNTHFYVSGLRRANKETTTKFEVVAVNKEYKRGSASTIEMVWPEYPAPTPNFIVSNTMIAPGESVTFTNMSSEVTEEVEWYFPGATVETTTEENPSVTYEKEGVYPVTLVAKNTSGANFEVKKELITVTKEASKGLENLSQGKTAVASSYVNDNEAPQFALDGNVKTKWCAVGDAPHSLTIDLGDVRTIGELEIAHAEAGGESSGMNSKEYTLEVSMDGKNFTEVLHVTDNTRATSQDAIPVIKAKYVRLTLVKPTQGADQAARIYEVRVNGVNNDITLPEVVEPVIPQLPEIPDIDGGDDTITPKPEPEKPSKQRGWIKENGNWFYYKEDGQKAIGWLPE